MKYSNDTILHSKHNDIEILQFKELLKYENELLHFFTLRHGGTSINEYDSLNLGMFTNDNTELIRQNYYKVCETFNIESNKLFLQKQEHTDIVTEISNENCNSFEFEKYIVSDASMTCESNICLVSNSADCMTIFIYDPIRKCISSIHSGWQGMLNDIVIKSIYKLNELYDSSNQNMICCVCPSICEKCFEVKIDVADKFEKKFGNKHIRVINSEKYTINLFGILKDRLIENGVSEKNIFNSNICTKCNHDDFYSYRVSKETGRMGNFILKK